MSQKTGALAQDYNAEGEARHEPGVAGSGGGAGAPSGAQYVTVALDAGLSNERQIAAGDGIQIVDGGANGNITVSKSDELKAAFRATLSGDQTISASTSTKVEFDTESYDKGGHFDTVDHDWTPPAGLVSIYAQLGWGGLNADDLVDVRIYKNGSVVARGFITVAAVSVSNQIIKSVYWEDEADGDDVYHIEAFTTPNANDVLGATNNSYFIGRWLGTI